MSTTGKCACVKVTYEFDGDPINQVFFISKIVRKELGRTNGLGYGCP